MKPFLRWIFYGINFTPFIQEAERRVTETGIQPSARSLLSKSLFGLWLAA